MKRSTRIVWCDLLVFSDFGVSHRKNCRMNLAESADIE